MTRKCNPILAINALMVSLETGVDVGDMILEKKLCEHSGPFFFFSQVIFKNMEGVRVCRGVL
jgi:hypothetical protein